MPRRPAPRTFNWIVALALVGAAFWIVVLAGAAFVGLHFLAKVW